MTHLFDSEVSHGLRNRVHRSEITANEGWQALDSWRRLRLSRYPMAGLLQRVGQLRGNLSAAYDASYVALAENLGFALVAADGRLARATGIRCPVTVVPS